MPLPPWPAPIPPAEDAHAVLGGELTMHVPLPGPRWQVGFAGSYELFVRREGVFRRQRRSWTGQAVMLWAHSRCPALHRALGNDVDLVLQTGTDPNTQDVVVNAVDAWDRRRGALLASAPRRELLARARVDGPQPAVLGEIRSLADLHARMAALGAPGRHVELRREEAGLVVARAMLQVDTARPGGRR